MDPAPSALLALAILGLVPGTLVYRAIRPDGSTLECVAIAPTLSFAFIFLFGEVASAAHVPFAPIPFLVALSLTALVAGVRWFRRRSSRTPVSRASVSRLAAALLLGGIVLAAGSWLLGVHGFGSPPPYTDSVNHGLMAPPVADPETP